MKRDIEKPTHEEPDESNKNHRRITINKSDMHVTQDIIVIEHSEMGYLSDIVWVGNDINQIAIFPRDMDNLHLSFDGFVLYKDKGFGDIVTIKKDSIIFPNDGSIFKMIKNEYHFFNSMNPRVTNINYNLSTNNTSIILNNISIYNMDYKKGCMINLRASFDGVLDSETIDGNVHILCSIDDIP